MTTSLQFGTHLAGFLEEHMHRWGAPGIALALTDRAATLHTAYLGHANVDARTPVTASTLFEIGSISKSFTAIALLQLHEAGRLDLHAPVSTALPWWEVRSDFAPITPHHLMSHTAGIINGSDYSGDAAHEVWSLRETRATSAPGERFHYSNVGYKALGLVLEAAEGRPYPEIVSRGILAPLGMGETHAAITHALRPRMAVGYDPLFDDRPYRPGQALAPAVWFEYGWADGSIASTPDDMARYARMLLARGQAETGRLISERSFDLLSQRVAQPEDEDHGTFYGYGLQVSEVDGHTCLSHGGGMVGYQAHLLVDLDDGLGVVVMINGPGSSEAVARFALRLAGADRRADDLGSIAREHSPGQKPSDADLGGEYRGERRAFRVESTGSDWFLVLGDARHALQAHESGAYAVDHEEFGAFLLRFVTEDGLAVEAFHGPDWYPHARYAGPTTFAHPPAWRAFVGHYRSHNPWLTNFRVVLRKGVLAVIDPYGEEEALAPVDEATFRLGEDPRSPEWVRFDTVIDGAALRASRSGCSYYRTFTP